MIWKPNVTVAVVVEQQGRFLLVEEETATGLQFNQPAGHIEPGEGLIAAAIREALEETAYHVSPTALIGVYRQPAPEQDLTYLRFAFAADVLNHEPERSLDKGIVRAVWLSMDEIRATAARHRSPLVWRCVEDYLADKRYPLDLLQEP